MPKRKLWQYIDRFVTGILTWEIFSAGMVPYSGLNNRETMQKVSECVITYQVEVQSIHCVNVTACVGQEHNVLCCFRTDVKMVCSV